MHSEDSPSRQTSGRRTGRSSSAPATSSLSCDLSNPITRNRSSLIPTMPERVLTMIRMPSLLRDPVGCLIWVIFATCGVIVVVMPVLLPERPAWQAAGGILYSVGALLLIRLFDYDVADIMMDSPSWWRRQPIWTRVLIRTGQFLLLSVALALVHFLVFLPFLDITFRWGFLLGIVSGAGLYMLVLRCANPQACFSKFRGLFLA